MYKDILRSITGIEIYPLISFGIFFAFFIALLLYVVLVNKDHIKAMAQLPLKNENQPEVETKGGMWS
ncbi:MAG: hypothetical protein LPJ89_05165 [Hymenobacteraceae bacterium]|nr:hypothetical protein [Hymenobacteraceae bacterium]MDX5396537.1 hypothetical protein [Hymenobacteraceae bacterium]MDX5443157.1 hypothetical protein [Hymenobacteraceae bacterium]MDX5512601.1 hypothetical protein [Hymenobacteraceae bacterium]